MITFPDWYMPALLILWWMLWMLFRAISAADWPPSAYGRSVSRGVWLPASGESRTRRPLALPTVGGANLRRLTMKAFFRSALLAAAFCCPLAIAGAQEPPAPAPQAPAVKIRHRIPSGWSKLGLTTAQRRAIYAVQDQNAAKRAELKRQLAELDRTELREFYKILTPAQRDTLAGK